MVRLQSGDHVAYFTGDAFHDPLQLTRPELHLRGCDDLAGAIATRHAHVERVLDDGALVFPAHFPPPQDGSLRRRGGDVRFVPAATSG